MAWRKKILLRYSSKSQRGVAILAACGIFLLWLGSYLALRFSPFTSLWDSGPRGTAPAVTQRVINLSETTLQVLAGPLAILYWPLLHADSLLTGVHTELL